MAKPATSTKTSTRSTTSTANAGGAPEAGAADDKATGSIQPANVPATGTGGTVTGEGATAGALSSEATNAGGEVTLPQDGGATADGGLDRTGFPERIYVRGPEKGRWRAGQFFTLEPKEVVVSELTDDELLALSNDPVLTMIRAE